MNFAPAFRFVLLASVGVIFAADPEASTATAPNPALGKEASASTSAPGLEPAKAVDGSFGTRWRAGHGHSIAPTAETATTMWRWTIESPEGDWPAPDFDDSAWHESRGGFGSAGTPNAAIGTAWTSDEIWLRRDFELSAEDLEKPLQIRMYHDNDAEVFLNGVPILKRPGHVENYELFDLDEKARAALEVGRNTLAVHCRQAEGGQFVDAGIIRPVEVWWQVDLGEVVTIGQTELTQDREASPAPYFIESSVDGGTWEIYADRREDLPEGAIAVDRKLQVARFLRVNFPGSSAADAPAEVREFRVTAAP